MDWSKKIIWDDSFIERDLGDEIVLMSQDGQGIHSFEGSAIWVWAQIKKEQSADNILKEMTKEYEVDEDVARNDLEAFLNELIEKGIIKK